MADPKDDGRHRAATQTVPIEKAGSADDGNRRSSIATETKMPPAGGYSELRTEEEPRENDRFQDKEDAVGAEFELLDSRSPVLGGPSNALAGEEGHDVVEGEGDVHEYKVYKRRWFGLVQLTLLNIIISWDVSTCSSLP
jgi:hypothetical protein